MKVFKFLALSILVNACTASEPGTIGDMTKSNEHSQISVVNLQTEYRETPLGIDMEQPRFSWQMGVASGERGYAQSARHIIVTNPEGNEVWNTGRVADDSSVHIRYEGEPLEPVTRYDWEVTVWNQVGVRASESSWFETGLMNPDPDLSAWDGATWIGGGDEDLVFYPHYLSVFKVRYKIQLDRESNSTKAGFIFGANDHRLLNKNLNIMNIENRKDEVYIEFELDISEVDGTDDGLAKVNVYRAGYHPEDSQHLPFASFDVPLSLIDSENKYDRHEIFFESVFGVVTIYVNGEEREYIISKKHVDGNVDNQINLNPVGRGGDFISYPMVGDIGFKAGPGQIARFSDLEVLNYRHPSNPLFRENLSDISGYEGIFEDMIPNVDTGLSIREGAYVADGGNTGTKVIADPARNSAPMLRTEFRLGDKQINHARLYVTSRGIYEIYLNGKRVGDRYFTPGVTQYNRHHMYQTYDITEFVSTGENNALGAWLSEGWWSGNITFRGENWNFFGDRQSLLAKLVVTYSDGSRDVITTSPDTWSFFGEGPVLYGSFFQGEVYDAGRESEIAGWSSPGYDESAWKPAVEVPLQGTAAFHGPAIVYVGTPKTLSYDSLKIVGQTDENPGIARTLTARRVDEVRPGVFVYDMGQNMVGFPQITLTNTAAGDTITLRYAEVRYPDMEEYEGKVGMVMMENIRAALAQDRYIARGADEEIIRPRFTFHGYRYVEISGINEPVPVEEVKGIVISSVEEFASHYHTSNDMVNRLWKNTTWSMMGNFLSIPTDTPARNERMGWNGDLNVFARAATYLGHIGPFLNRHMLAMRDMQDENGRFPDVAPVGGGFGGTLWGSAGVLVAWEIYQQYGDLGLLEEHFQAMKDYVAYLNSRIDEQSGILQEGPLGDWLSPEEHKNDNTLLWSAYHIRSLEILAKTAELLGRSDDAARFRDQYEKRKEHFNETYIDPETHKTIHSRLGTGGFRQGGAGDSAEADTLIDTQASYAVPLALGVLDEEHVPYAADHLASAVRRQNSDQLGRIRPGFSLMTGFIGTASLNKALSEHGYDDMAYRLLQQTTYPSWLYPVVNDATTIWERLNSYTHEEGFGGNNSMNSFNHYAFGAVVSWMYSYSLGIQRDPDAPAFKHFILKPTPDPTGIMKYAGGYYDSMYGRIESRWQVEGDILHYHATVPPNSAATLYLPASSETMVMENGNYASEAEGITFTGYENDKVIYELVSGTYEFMIPWQSLYD